MKTFKFIKAPRGFSMIEVLISVVVLGFGLLALAALQTTIIRSSSETKAQTIALQLAKDKLEELRSFQNLTGYQALTTGNDAVNDSTGSLSGVNFTRTWLVTRFAYNPTTKAFVSVTPLVGTTPTGGTSPSTYVANNEYKRVAVTVTWSDANGVPQNIGLEDGLGAISPGDGSKVTLNNLSTSQARKPRVLIYDPGLTGGVIPIAIGNGSSTAASNPVPVLKGKTDAVAETLFEVLTYAGTSGNVLAQSRVETAVVGCTCSTANAPASKGYRPTYWNGFRYAPPVQTSDNATAGWTVPGGANNTAESDRCTACCRDHRDPSGVAGAKFDPWRSNHAHYLRVDNTTLTAAPTGTYSEACRLIRIDGFFRVASDFRNDYLGLLEVNNNGDITNTNQNLRAYSPKVDTADATKDSKKKYENFILDYMDDRFSNNLLLTFNTPLAVASYEATYGLNSPYEIDGTTQAPIPMKPTALEKGENSKWSHARGLYIDWIEPEAKDIIKAAQDTCGAKTTQLGRNTCALPYVPFTSVNLTELADWKSKLAKTDTANNATVITVANNAFIDPVTGDTNVPTRGNVYKGSAPTNNATSFALSYITESNSGIALKAPIDIDDALLSDNQEYKINSSGDPPDTGAVAFQITISNWNTASAPIILDYITNSNTCTTASSDPAFPNPYSCNFGPDGSGNTQVKVTGYTKTSTVAVPNGCATSGTVGLPIIVDYNVSGATNPNGTAAVYSYSGDQTINDTTVIYYNPVLSGSTLGLQFSGPVRYCPSNYNPSVVNKAKNNDPDPDGYACTKDTKVPTWSTTLVVCPSGTP